MSRFLRDMAALRHTKTSVKDFPARVDDPTPAPNPTPERPSPPEPPTRTVSESGSVSQSLPPVRDSLPERKAPPVSNNPPVWQSPSEGYSPPVRGPIYLTPARRHPRNGGVNPKKDQDVWAMPGRAQKVRRVFSVQHGHSAGEQTLYSALWSNAKPETGETRLITIGYRGMADLTGAHKTNCKLNSQSLIDKLAIEVVGEYNSDASIGRTYRVFSFKEILRRRESAGLVWVVRTNGVRFVSAPVSNPPTASESPPEPQSPAQDSDLRTEAESNSHTAPVRKTHTQLGIGRNAMQESSTSDRLELRKLLSAIGPVDDNALTKLIERCRSEAPDCTVEEIAHFSLQKARLAKQNRIGLVLFAVPPLFASGAHLKLREESERGREAVEREREEHRRMLQEIVIDPGATDTDRKLAEQMLESLS